MTTENQTRYRVTLTNVYTVWADDEKAATRAVVRHDNGRSTEEYVEYEDSDIEVDVIEQPRLTRFSIDYTVNLHHTVEIDARDEEHAKELFEEMYNSDNGLMPEYYDISHDVVSVEPTAMQ